MKSYNLDKLLENDEIIKTAIINCCRSKKRKKDHKNSKYYLAQRILKNVDHYVQLMKEHIKNYKPSKVNTFEIVEKHEKKVRKITTVPLFPDQIIHQIIVDLLKPILTKSFYTHFYASIPGRGTHKAKKYVEKAIRKNSKDFKHISKLDIRKCYQNISHDLLKNKLRKKLRGNKLFNLICKVIDHYCDRVDENGKYGIPIGFSTSQWFCNFLLTQLDYFAKQTLKIKIYIRYMDDIVSTGRNKKLLHKNQKELMLFLSNMKLEVKKNYQVFRFNYRSRNSTVEKGRFLDFLGFKFYRNRITIRKHIFINLIKQSKQILLRKSNVNFKIAAGYISRFSYIKHTNSFKIFNKYLKNINIKKLKGVVRNESRKHAQTCC